MQPNTDGSIAIEGFYDWGPGVVVTHDCLGRSYRTTLADRRLTVTVRASVVEPPLIYKRPDNWVNVDPPNPWGELRSSNTADDGSAVPVTVSIKRVRITIWLNNAESTDVHLGPQLDDALSPWWDSLSPWIEVVTSQDLAALGERRPKRPRIFHPWAGNPDGTMRPLSMKFYGNIFPLRTP